MFKHAIHLKLLVTGTLLCAITCATAAPNAGALNREKFVAYQVTGGDTLSVIASKHLLPGTSLQELVRINNLHRTDRIHPRQTLWLPRHLVRFTRVEGVVNSIQCVSGLSQQTPDGALKFGQAFGEAQSMAVPQGCHVGLSLPDNTSVRLAPGSTLTFALLRKYSAEFQHVVRLELSEGSVQTSADPLIKRLVPLQVQTPLAMTGVRGTEFRVSYQAAEGLSRLEVTQGLVLNQGNADNEPQPVPTGFGLVVSPPGNSTGLEKLLQAPVFKQVEFGPSPEALPTVVLMPLDGATKYRVQIASAVTAFGGALEKVHAESSFVTDRLKTNATVFRVVAEAKSGLQGASANLALCSPADIKKSSACSVAFDLPDLASGLAKFSLSRSNGQDAKPLMTATPLPSAAGRFVLRGLEPGFYQWRVDYDPSTSKEDPVQPALSGSFTLHAQEPV